MQINKEMKSLEKAITSRVLKKAGLFRALGLGFLLLTTIMAALILTGTIGQPGRGLVQLGQSDSSSVALQVPILPSATIPFQGKPGETGPPTPFPTYSLPPMTPVPPNGDQDFNNTPTRGFYIPPTPLPTDPYVIHINTTLGYSTIEESTELSDLVVMGTIKHVGPAQWTTADGKRPANPRDPGNRHYIFTPVVVQVSNSFKGLNAGAGVAGTEVVFLTVGGQVGQDKIVVSSNNDTLFEVGQQEVLFLNETKPMDVVQTFDNRPLLKLRGRYTVTADGMATNWYSSIPLAQLIEEIEKAAHKTTP
ncbi:MAG TPA: hypothetical protein VF952_11885 [Chloroflexia bacterium]